MKWKTLREKTYLHIHIILVLFSVYRIWINSWSKHTFFYVPVIFKMTSLGFFHVSPMQLTLPDAEAYCSNLSSSIWTPNSEEEVRTLIDEGPTHLGCKYLHLVTSDDGGRAKSVDVVGSCTRYSEPYWTFCPFEIKWQGGIPDKSLVICISIFSFK